jgi:hypothetical protein
MITEGFWNTLVANVAPAITVISNLILKFFAENSSGWGIANAVAYGFSQTLRLVVGGVTFVYGAMQVLSGVMGAAGHVGFKAFSLVLDGIGLVLEGLEYLLSQLPGVDLGLQSAAGAAADYVQSLADAAGVEADVYANAARGLVIEGGNNMRNPFAGFDAEMAKVIAKAGESGGQKFGQAAAQQITAAVKASSQSLKAMVIGTSEAESYMNRIQMGFDPRDAGDAAERTAEATESSLDALLGIREGIEDIDLATASITV